MKKKLLTPCIKQCRLENNKCVGCKRTLEQIQHWSKMTDVERQQTISSLKTNI